MITANQGFKCNVDLVFCIDATGGMNPIVENFKETAKSLYCQQDIHRQHLPSQPESILHLFRNRR